MTGSVHSTQPDTMTDLVTRATRSRMMGRIHSFNTAPERAVRSFLHRSGLRFRLHSRMLPGTPDIVLPCWSTAVFVHGCFWHRHEGCRFAYTPRSNVAFWRMKLGQRGPRQAKRPPASTKRLACANHLGVPDHRERPRETRANHSRAEQVRSVMRLAAKMLAAVEVSAARSHQHELNAGRLRLALGLPAERTSGELTLRFCSARRRRARDRDV